LLAAPFLDLRSSVRHRGEEGLLSIAFHPRYRENRLVYVAFDDLRGDVNLVEYRTDGRRALVPTARRIFFVDKLEGVTWHNGGQLQFGPDGRLYFSTGDSAHTPLDDVPTPVTDPNQPGPGSSDPVWQALPDRRRQRAVARRDGGLWAPESLAVLVRQRDGRSLPR
jgi:glucose/arabinose dehydrogenase